MAAPYRANYQLKVKAPTSEDSKRYRAKPCRSLRQSLYTCKPAKHMKEVWRKSNISECDLTLILKYVIILTYER